MPSALLARRDAPLAQSDEPANVVARAVVQACNDAANFAADRKADSSAALGAADPEKVRTQVYQGNGAEGDELAMIEVVPEIWTGC